MINTIYLGSFVRKLQIAHVSSLSFLITLAVTGTMFGIASVVGTPANGLENKFMPGHVQLFGMYDSTYQRLGHRVGLVLLVILVFMAVLIKRNQISNYLVSSDAELKTVKGFKLLFGGFLMASCVLVSTLGYYEPFGSVAYLLLSFVAVGAYMLLTPHISRSQFYFVARGATICYLIYLIVPAFFSIPRVSASELGAVQFHYAIVLAWADRLAIDPAFFAQRLPHYGLILPTLLGAYQHHFGLLNFGQHIRLVQVSQALFLLLSCLALYLWKPQRPFYVLFALMFFGTFVSTSHASVLYPNQSGWRFMGFPLWIILLLLTKNTQQKRASFILGCGTGFLLLFNLETGIAVTIGCLIFLVSRERFNYWRERVKDAIMFVAGVILVMLIFCILFRLEFDNWPFSISSLNNQNLLRHFIGGYGGLPLKVNLLSLFIFMHCVYIVSSIIIRWCTCEIGLTQRIRLAVATVILIWYAYYMNRPDGWNLWTYFFLYSFLMADFLDARLMRPQWHRRGLLIFADIRIASLACLLLPLTLQLNHVLLKQEVSSFAEATSFELAMVSGVNVQRVLATALKGKAAYLAALSRQDKTVYLSRDNQFMPLMTKQLNPFNVQDAYLENFDSAGVKRVVNDILTDNPRYLLIDDPLGMLNMTDFASKYRLSFYSTVTNALASRYRKIGVASDWIIWERMNAV